jgi:hypothetical protein
MSFHSRFEPEVSPIQMSKELARACNTNRGSSIEQSYLYFEGSSAAGWADICNQQDYVATFESYSFDWVADLIKDHLFDTKFRKNRIDLIGIGSGDGKKEGKLIQGILDLCPDLQVRCHLLDKSNPLLVAAHNHLNDIFENSGRVEVFEHQGDFCRLSNLSDLFDSEENEQVLRVGCMFGGTLGNLDNELRFVRDSLSAALKPGDLFIPDVVLGFAPADDPSAIKLEDPRMSSQGVFQNLTNNWLLSTLKRYREEWGSASFKHVLHAKGSTTSPIPNTYTIETHVIVDSGTHKSAFNMLRLHRYDQSSFIGTILKEGFQRLGGRTYGAQDKKFMYVFVKE